jgi:hypothetical protein
MELSEKIRWVEAFLMGGLEGQQLAEYERLCQENTITRQEIERIRKAKSDLTTALIQRKVLATLENMRQAKRQKSVKLLQRGAMASILMAAACVGMLYLTYSPVELKDPLVDSINKGADMPNSTPVDARQEEALTLFTQGRQYLESEQPVLAVQSTSASSLSPSIICQLRILKRKLLLWLPNGTKPLTVTAWSLNLLAG